MTSVVINSQKGGVGKTTIAVNLSYSLAKRGWKVLVVDADVQGGLGFSLTEKAKDAPGFFDFLSSEDQLDFETVQSAIMGTKLDGLSLLTRGSREATDRLIGTRESALYEFNRLRMMDGILRSLPYDLVLFDTATGLGPASLDLCRCADYILVPERPEQLCLRSLPQILRLVATARSNHAGEGEGPRLAGFVLSIADSSDPSNLADQQEFRDLLPSEMVFETVIPEHPDFREASRAAIPVALLRERPSQSSLIFDRLAAEFEERTDLYDEAENPEPIDYEQFVD
ncbi:MAG: ParA family protein [Verrucomicrobiales bacterium]|nr:ParA family protein [Verrucomicrobiales bacterium]